jgi:pimeloyl-ACP methyl ester carboxylesterase
MPSLQTFDVGGVELCAKRWGVAGGLPVLALHGWLDNAASFDFLAPLLPSCDLVCLDCAGHGRSGQRDILGAYNIWQDVGELFAVADQLGWSSFSLLGHSRGAMICFLAAGTFPVRITHLNLLEGGIPRIASASQAPELLAEAIRTVKAATVRPRQYYSSFARAVAARTNGLFPLAEEDAEVLALHGVVETERGFTWSYDPKLLAGSEVRFSLEQLLAFRERITAATMVVLAEGGMLLQEQGALELLEARADWQVAHLPGGHHHHMHEQAPAVAELIKKHIGCL